jgi:hypothetical protein
MSVVGAGDLSGFEGHDVPVGDEAPATPMAFEELPPSSDAHALLALSGDLRVPENLVKSFLTALQADQDTSVEDFGFCTPEEVEEAMGRMLDAVFVPPTAPERAKLRRFHKKAQQIAKEVPPSAPASSTQTPVPAQPAVKPPKKRKFEAVLGHGGGRDLRYHLEVGGSQSSQDLQDPGRPAAARQLQANH